MPGSLVERLRTFLGAAPHARHADVGEDRREVHEVGARHPIVVVERVEEVLDQRDSACGVAVVRGTVDAESGLDSPLVGNPRDDVGDLVGQDCFAVRVVARPPAQHVGAVAAPMQQRGRRADRTHPAGITHAVPAHGRREVGGAFDDAGFANRRYTHMGIVQCSRPLARVLRIERREKTRVGRFDRLSFVRHCA